MNVSIIDQAPKPNYQPHMLTHESSNKCAKWTKNCIVYPTKIYKMQYNLRSVSNIIQEAQKEIKLLDSLKNDTLKTRMDRATKSGV